MDKLTKGWVHHLRKTAREETAGRASCPVCDAQVAPDIDSFKAHVRADAAAHPGLDGDAEMEKAFQAVAIHLPQASHASVSRAADAAPPGRRQRKRPTPGHPDPADPTDAPERLADAADAAAQPDATQRGGNKMDSPLASVVKQRSSSPSAPAHGRMRADEALGDFDRGHASKKLGARQLWNPDDDSHHKPLVTRPPHAASHNIARRPKGQGRSSLPQGSPRSVSSDSVSTSDMIRQPETQPISHEQLVAEVKGIYAGLVMIESKCIEYDSSQQAKSLTKEQYSALIALHHSVLHEHHDFFLASQHPSATDALRRLASKYAMPARMWRHGIHSFLELLRHKLPGSLEHMLTFIYIAYSMMTLLLETVPAFEDTWIECLGDLGRYRMAIEDDDIRDRETWTGVSRYWYTKASDKSPTTGRLYHHLAILARPNALQQLYYYAKSLCVPIPFPSARDSVMTLFDPLLSAATHQRLEPVDAAFVRVHGILFSGKAREQLQASMDDFCDLLDGRIGSARSHWLEAGYCVGISLGCLLLGFGAESNVIMRAIARPRPEADVAMGDGGKDEGGDQVDDTFQQALSFAVRTYAIVLRRWGDKNTLSCLHTTMVFLLHVSRFPSAMTHVEKAYPWKLTSIMLNYLLRTIARVPRIDTDAFPGPEKEGEPPYPLPEDYALRGLVYAEDYFPDGWFENDRIDESDRYLEPPSKALERQERILWIGRRLAAPGRWLTWDATAGQFGVADEYDVVLDDLPDYCAEASK